MACETRSRQAALRRLPTILSPAPTDRLGKAEIPGIRTERWTEGQRERGEKEEERKKDSESELAQQSAEIDELTPSSSPSAAEANK